MTIGIYAIFWEDNFSKVYVGQSVNIEKRCSYHLWQFKAARHANVEMQQAYTLYGAPTTIILEKCSIDHLFNKEISWINELDAIASGYNITHPDRMGSGHLAPNSKYSKLSLLILFRMLRNPELGYEYLSKITGINKSTVLQISRGEKHPWLHEKYPSISRQVEAARLHRLDVRRTDASKIFTVCDPNGVQHEFTNIYRFCREHKLNVGNFHGMLYGKTKHCKGFYLNAPQH